MKIKKKQITKLDKDLCNLCGVDEVEQFFVNYIDKLDDKIKVEKFASEKEMLLKKKTTLQELRYYYSEMMKYEH